jgi:hypothetical protein
MVPEHGTPQALKRGFEVSVRINAPVHACRKCRAITAPTQFTEKLRVRIRASASAVP